MCGSVIRYEKHKSPSNDGLTKIFYVFFLKRSVILLLQLFVNPLKLINSSRLGVVALIEKKDQGEKAHKELETNLAN